MTMVHPQARDNHPSDPVRRSGGLLHGPDGGGQRVRKLLVKVTVEGSVGPVAMVMAAESTVADLVKAVVEVYKREKRRPLMSETTDSTCFELHYSPFSLDCLKMEEKLAKLDSRNFFLCRKPDAKSKMTCSAGQAKIEAKSTFPLTKLMDFLL